ncbi:MAG: c-type cytochrome, partial [Nitrospiria bacterium]
EVVSRRSWKEYQREFNSLELKRVQEEHKKSKEQIEAEDARRDQLPDPVTDENQLSLRRIRLKIEEVEVKMEGEEFRKVRSDLDERKIRLSDAKQRFGFAKADQDEVYYEWKHALEEGHQSEAEKYKQEYYELEEKIKELGKKVEEAETQVSEVQKVIDGYFSELKKWQGLEKKYFEPLEKLEKRMNAIRSRGLDIKQVVIDDLGKGGPVVWGSVDRCESCHAAINRDGFENEKNPFKTHPFRVEIFGKHPIEQFGCTTCHGGQGRATQIKGKPLEKGDFAHGFVHHWTDPLKQGDWMQSSCNKCHQDQWKLDHAPVYMAGKKLFWDLGCTGCHVLKGFEEAPRVGPSLRKVADKVSRDWLIAWIKNPHDYLPHTKMPRPPLDIEEPGQTEKVAAYILQSSEPYDLPFGRYPGGDAREGKRIFETVGCYGCHTLGDKGTGLAPALDKIASKTNADWIYNWIQDP